MARAFVVGLLGSLFLSPAGCSSSKPSSSAGAITVRDTLENEFTALCSNGYCTLSPSPTDSSLQPHSCDNDPNGGTDRFVLLWGARVLAVHAILDPASGGDILLNPAQPAHPIACVTAADCLQSVSPVPYTCQAGLCQNLSARMTTVDVIALCQHDIPWPSECPYLTSPTFAFRMTEVAAACGSQTECSVVPPDCRQVL